MSQGGVGIYDLADSPRSATSLVPWFLREGEGQRRSADYSSGDYSTKQTLGLGEAGGGS